MSEWTDGYRAALSDVERIANSRSLLTVGLAALFQELHGDALIIEHEQGNKLQRRRLAAAREAVQLQGLPLFKGKGAAGEVV